MRLKSKCRTVSLLTLIAVLGSAAAASASSAYVDTFVSYTPGVDTGIGQPYGAHDGLWPVGVNPADFVGAPKSGNWLSLPTGADAIYGFTGFQATTGITVYTVAAGGGEQASVYGRDAASDPWTLIGQVSEPEVALTLDPSGTFLSLSGTGLTGLTQIMVVGLDTLGSSPGYDLMGLRGSNGVPEPGTWALMLAGFGGLGLALRSRRRTAAFAVA